MDKIVLKVLIHQLLILGFWLMICVIIAAIITLVYVNWYKIEPKLNKFIEEHH